MHNFYQLYYHLIWSTKNREPIITIEVEKIILDYIPIKIKTVKSAYYQIGITDNHLHLVATIPPNLSVSKFVKEIKGSSSRLINKSLPENFFNWQAGFGCVSFSQKSLPFICQYAAKQKEHHKNNDLVGILEKDLIYEE